MFNTFKTLLIFIIVFIPSILSAQFVCPPEDGTNCTTWEIGIYQTTTENPDCILKVTYRWRRCDGVYQIYIDEVQKTGNCSYLINGTSAKSFNEWLDLVLIEEIANLSSEPPPAECPDSSLKAIFYTASCGLWVKCEYNIDSASRVCDADWRGSYPNYTVNGVNKISVWKWQSCGITCCKKTYSICKISHTTTGSYDIFIKSVTKEKIGDCSNPDNVVSPCEDGC